MRLFPSQIRYSQASISNTFTESGDLIGDVLDDLYYGHMQKREFPKIEVARYGNNWYTADNRRLWVFQKLELLGRCRRIPVDIIEEIPPKKMTTTNGGMFVKVRGYPGGECVRRLEYYPSSESQSESDDEGFYCQFENFGL